MDAILIVCTGNVCRSPIAEGLLRAALQARLGPNAPAVSSAGTMGLSGSPPDPNSIDAAAERGVDISAHRARELSVDDVEAATLILGMSADHDREVVASAPEAASRTFTLKELVRLLEALPETTAGDVGARVAAADDLRTRGFDGDPGDRDVADPLGMPLASFRVVASELDEWCSRLVDGLLGRAEAPVASGADGG